MNPNIYKKGKNLEDIQEMNRSLIIRLLHKLQLCSRAELAKETGLKQATITNIINDLIKLGLVKETGIIAGEKGRRSIGLKLDIDNLKIIGVRLTRNYILAGIFNLYGDDFGIKYVDLDMRDGSKSALDKIKKAIDSLIKGTNSKDKVIGAGIATPGPFFRDEGRIGLMTEFPGWEHIFLQKELETYLGVPVFIEHDANAGALAEWWFGNNKKDKGILIYIAAGQGVGAGIIIDGVLFRGSLGIAGEIGHMSIDYNGKECECGNRGCLEQYCSTIAVRKEIKKELINYPESKLNKNCTLESIFEAIKNGDESAQKIFKKAAWFLGFGIANLLNIYNPDTIIIGDELAQTGSQLLDIVKSVVKENTLPSIFNNLEIKLSEFKEDSVLMGTIALTVDKILQSTVILKKSI